ncbi:MAG TPA: hypothetical protein GX392_03470 [Clostridiales bacterium]|nr:hypothetical protein [Clostridiales bacterium]
MSFYSYKNEGNECCPGNLSFDGLKKITEKVCIQVNKVYDSCLQQETLDNVKITIDDITDNDTEFVLPLTFLSCQSISVKGKLVGTKIERIPERPKFARVRTNVKIPLKVFFEDANGKKGSGYSLITIPKDVVMFVPDESVIPFELESVVNAVCVSGTFISNETVTFDVDMCITIILKIIAKVELLIPAFGFCEIPPCEEFAENVCDEFFRLPLFPPQLKKPRIKEEPLDPVQSIIRPTKKDS